VKHGATTIWERWNGWTHQDGYFDPHMNSFNHYSLASVGEWLFRHVAGIELDPDAPGFQTFVLRPYIGEGLDSARGTYRTMHGEILSGWTRAGSTLAWNIRVPANTSAKVYVPAAAGSAVTEGGRPVEEAVGLRVVGREAASLVCDVTSGYYCFVSTV
jgi:alpha-L-rhamnosidase